MSQSTSSETYQGRYHKAASYAMLIIGVHSLISGFVHIFTQWNFFDVNPPDFLWALAILGNRQLFVGTIQVAVSLNYDGLGRYLSKLAFLSVFMSIFMYISTAINGRYLYLVAPRSTGNFMPKVLLCFSTASLILSNLDKPSHANNKDKKPK